MRMGRRFAALLLAFSLVFADLPYMAGTVWAKEAGGAEIPVLGQAVAEGDLFATSDGGFEQVFEQNTVNRIGNESGLYTVNSIAGDRTTAYQYGGLSAEASSEVFANAHTLGYTAEFEEYLYQKMLSRTETIDIESFQIPKDQIGTYVYGAINEHPDLYFVKGGFSYYTSGSIVTRLLITYQEGYDHEAFKRETQKALAVVTEDMSDLEKAVALHEYLVVNTAYDYQNLLDNTLPETVYTAYGILVNHTGVCQGYALTYKYLLNTLGIECYMVSSANINHAWNMIVLDGKYYQVDTTWDDPVWDKAGQVCHSNMFRSDAGFANHIADGKEKDWIIKDGGEVLDITATDTTYESAFFVNSNAPLILHGEECYYIAQKERSINKASLSNLQDAGTSLKTMGSWPVWGKTGYNWVGAYSGLFRVGNRLYYNDKSGIYSLDIKNPGDVRTEFTADTSSAYVYGCVLRGGKVYYSMHQTPSFDGEETLFVADIDFGKESVTISGISIEGGVYKQAPYQYSGTAKVVTADRTDVTEAVNLVYSYSGTTAGGTSYGPSSTAPIDAGSYQLTVSVDEDSILYSGSAVYPYEITAAPVTVKAKDYAFTIGKGDLPDTYEYIVTGLLGSDSLSAKPSFGYQKESGETIQKTDIDLTKEGIYRIVPKGADAGSNYAISYEKGTLTIAISREEVTISGITMKGGTYTGKPYVYSGGAVVRTADKADVTKQVELTYSYSGTCADGKAYGSSEEAPADAGSYKLTVSVSQTNLSYRGSIEYPYEITPAEATVIAKDYTFVIGHEDALPDTYEYVTEGLLNDDRLTVAPSYSYQDLSGKSIQKSEIDLMKEGQFQIVPSGASAGANYTLDYKAGVLSLEIRREPVTISGITIVGGEYIGEAYVYGGKAVVRTADQTDVTDKVTLTYSYSGTAMDGDAYGPASAAPVKAGSYKLTVSVPESNYLYGGKAEYEYVITQAPLNIKPKDCTLIIGRQDTLPATYEYSVTGLVAGDKLRKEPAFGYQDADGRQLQSSEVSLVKEGTYYLVAEAADAGCNYNITYGKGILSVEAQREEVTISGITMKGGIYTGRQYVYEGNAVVAAADGENVTGKAALTYIYNGRDAGGKSYGPSAVAPVSAGTYRLTVAVPATNLLYKGEKVYDYVIQAAPVTVAARNYTYVIGQQEPLPETFSYSVTGLLNGDSLVNEPGFAFVDSAGNPISRDQLDLAKEGSYSIIPTGAEAGMNYAVTAQAGTLTVKDAASSGSETEVFEVAEIETQIYTGSAIKPTVLVYDSNGTLLKLNKDYTVKYYNNILADSDSELSIGGTSRDGNEENGFSRDLAYAVITGKGNYSGTIYCNFHINPRSISIMKENVWMPAKGFTLKYKEQLVQNDKKAQTPFVSLKYKKALKPGEDIQVTLTAIDAYTGDGDAIAFGSIVGEGDNPAIAAGYHGRFLMTVTGKGNYICQFDKTIVVAKKSQLMQNVTVTLGKNQKSVSAQPDALKEGIELNPGYYDSQTKKYYRMKEDGNISTVAEANGDKLFIVKSGKKCLVYGQDYTVSYESHHAVGTAYLVVHGIGSYAGSKRIAFKIMGIAFNSKNITVDDDAFQEALTYTGKPLEQQAGLFLASGHKALVKDRDYTVSYKNNTNKGTATVIYTGNPKAGYSGTIRKTFKIDGAQLANLTVVSAANGEPAGSTIKYVDSANLHFGGKVGYTAKGATISDRIRLVNKTTGAVLKEGRDYTVSYKNNKALSTESNQSQKPYALIRGKGNYTQTLKVTFDISKGSLGAENITMAPIPLNGKADYVYSPKIKVSDGKKALSAGKDYNIIYKNNDQANVTAYVNGESTASVPVIVITVPETGDYRLVDATGKEVSELSVPLAIYKKQLKKAEVYICVEEPSYTGGLLTPGGDSVRVYIGSPAAVKAAYKAKEKDDHILSKSYGLTRLSEGEDYTLSYGRNLFAGKNKGSLIVNGQAPKYGGSVKVKFTIFRKEIYN